MPSALFSTPQWPLARRLAAVAAVVLVFGAFASAVVTESALGLRPVADRYNIWAWEARHWPNKWLYEAGELFRGSRSEEQQNADIERFFALTRQINTLQRDDAADPAQIRALRDEREALENRVEYTMEQRISAVLADFGLTRSFGPLGDRVFPPVDFEFTDSPRNLVTSPRDRIELQGTELLRTDLSLEEIETIEDRTLRDENLSALAAATAGIGAYPSIVDYLSSYESALDVAAHEWTHNYLFFSPLGFNYYANNDIRTMNEVVADLVGREVAEEVLRRWPLSAPQPEPVPTPEPPPAEPEEPRFDLRAALRALREEVDALLAAGQIEEAEALMEERRQEIVANGIYIRKINQAYFAFTNLYAGEDGSPGAVNPIGPKLDELRQRSLSLQRFVEAVRGITTVEELDRLLADTSD